MIELGKKYQTRDGRAVRILCVDGPRPDYPVVGFIGDEHSADSWTAEGKMFAGFARSCFPTESLDLIPVPTKHEGWVALKMCGGSVMVDPQRVLIHAEVINVEVPDDGYRRFVAHVTWED